MKPILATTAALALCAASLSGCWGPSSPTAEAGGVTLHVVPKIGSLGDRQVLEVLTPMTEMDVATLEIRLEDVTTQPSTWVAQQAATGKALNQSAAPFDGRAISFANLRHNRQYMIHRKAVGIGNVEISKPLPPVPISVGTDTVATTATIVVELKDKVFAGEAKNTIDIVPGEIIATGASEAITF